MTKDYFYIETDEYKKLPDIKYRIKQTKLLNTVPGNRARVLLMHYLGNYLYIDEVQNWIISEVIKYEHKISKLSKPASNHFSIKPHLQANDPELTLYRRTLFELLL